MRPFRIAAAVLLVLPAVVAPAPVHAQDVQYETVTKLDFPGAMGTMMKAAAKLGGGSLDGVQKTSIKGARMRTDMDKSSTIVDLDGKRFITLDHDAKTYTSLTFEQMTAQVQAAAAQLKNEQAKAGQQGGETKMNFKFSVEPANQTEKIAGYDAERFYLTMQMEGEFTPEGATAREKGGTLVVLTDLWASKSAPIYQAMRSYQSASAQDWASSESAMTKAIAAAFAGKEGVDVAFEQSVKEARKVEGAPLRSVVYFVAVAPEQKFDRELATAVEKPKSGGVLKAAGKGMLGGLAGRLGAKKQEEQPAEAEQPPQANILKVTSETRNISTKAVDPKVFEIPAGYKEVKFEELMKPAK
ncbi:MAG: hypothetical protein FIB01_15300 [Gemmatimonadetes bacterium]|nr:hypothetical protein [Gemmatimonadota bacterium]